jgi:hypothetical protein
VSEVGVGSTDRCPRCGGAFHCGVNDPQPCACVALALDAALLATLRAQFDACLCVTCLAQLQTLEAAPRRSPA